jgi:hypothetical protein
MTKSKYIKLLWALFGLILICLFLPFKHGIDYKNCDFFESNSDCKEIYYWGYESIPLYFVIFFNFLIFLASFSYNSVAVKVVNSVSGFFLLIILFAIVATPGWGAVPIKPSVSFGYYISLIGTIALFLYTFNNLKNNNSFLVNKSKSNVVIFTITALSICFMFFIVSFVGKR